MPWRKPRGSDTPCAEDTRPYLRNRARDYQGQGALRGAPKVLGGTATAPYECAKSTQPGACRKQGATEQLDRLLHDGLELLVRRVILPKLVRKERHV